MVPTAWDSTNNSTMKKILILLLLSLVLPHVAMAGDDSARLSNTNSDYRGDKPGAPTEVIIIGSLHERHRDNTNYSTKALTEIIVGLSRQPSWLNFRPLSTENRQSRSIVLLPGSYPFQNSTQVTPRPKS